MCYKHHNIPTEQRWVAPIIDHMETHLWDDNEQGGDIWNGRCYASTLDKLTAEASTFLIPLQTYLLAFSWIQKLPGIFQWAQHAIYKVRHIELLQGGEGEVCLRGCPT